jgi:phage tail-like protein
VNRVADRHARPSLASNFRVEIGCAEVVFPIFRTPADVTQHATVAPDGAEHLVLRRASCGAPDLYAWWHKARKGRAPQRRAVRVTWLAQDHQTALLVWRFRNARPVALAYSPLRANDDALLIESIELAFDVMEME